MLQSAAQQAQEDAAVEGQVRGEMWGNLQGILAMLAGQGCNPLVQDMIHQIAVHFANEQSQSVAAERRLAGNLVKEKEARGQMQQQLHGGIQVNQINHTSAYTAQTDITVSMLYTSASDATTQGHVKSYQYCGHHMGPAHGVKSMPCQHAICSHVTTSFNPKQVTTCCAPCQDCAVETRYEVVKHQQVGLLFWLELRRCNSIAFTLCNTPNLLL